MYQIKSRAFVLKKVNYSETDRVVTLLTKNKGKMPFIAKGVRRPKSKKRGHLEIFNLIEFSGSIKNGKMGYLSEVTTVRSFPSIKTSLGKIALAYYFMEVVGRVSQHEDASEDLFKLVGKYLAKLEKTNRLKLLREEFIYDLLVLIGFWPKGIEMQDPDEVLEEVLERKLSSLRVGKRLL